MKQVIVTAALLSGLLTVSAQVAGPPETPCFRPISSSKASEFSSVVGRGPTETFYPWRNRRPGACDPDGGDCAKGPVVANGSPVEVVFAQGHWTCAVHQGPSGGGRVWLRTERLQPLVVDRAPKKKDWVGTWVSLSGGKDRLIVRTSGGGQGLSVSGRAYWYGGVVRGRAVVHSGSVNAEVNSDVNPIRVIEDGCDISMTLVGRYFKTSDNMGCGGANVRFQGFWRRLTSTTK